MRGEGRIAGVPNEGRIERMDRKTPIKFAVIPEREGEAVAYVRERGFESARIERDDNGFVYLVFPPLSDIECGRLAQALPIHLSAKIGFVMNGAPPFSAPDRNDD
jgi:hypothetical protein